MYPAISSGEYVEASKGALNAAYSQVIYKKRPVTDDAKRAKKRSALPVDFYEHLFVTKLFKDSTNEDFQNHTIDDLNPC